ncbi:hypothetical protein CEUSTIGMA_g9207.t1 [Chlamydomonas eustigma]|uniref:Phosphoglycerate mutase-like protein n=1 Tax=Chlamydomonas eustigma TaxID=1157962 RepID=A0A250XFU5_9CHLO|nr:hypothetical protein CEUSTIGMA_g9207.t1 [Chlamydomonas eustigma]|eukprot:GAX81779.1 hypothetical protein CEUSTIGMA_g9207.t1 [Chlamydomonas eustigma]
MLCREKIRTHPIAESFLPLTRRAFANLKNVKCITIGALSFRKIEFRLQAFQTHVPESGSTQTKESAKHRRVRKSEHHRRFTKEDFEVMPERIILIRHGESKGNIEKDTYCTQPDHSVPLTEEGRQQARQAGLTLLSMMRESHYLAEVSLEGSSQIDDDDFRIFILTSPYARTLETTDLLLEAFTDDQIAGVRSAVQLREQDFGNFQDSKKIDQDLSDRIKFGRFWFRFPNGESGADVYDRLTIFEDHLVRDMIIGRYSGVSLVLVTHGLTLRIFLMKWFHWTVDEFLEVYNPKNCDPVVLEKLPWATVSDLQDSNHYIHAKQCYCIAPSSMAKLRGCDSDMASYVPRKKRAEGPKSRWLAHRQRSKYYNSTAKHIAEMAVLSGSECVVAAAAEACDPAANAGGAEQPCSAFDATLTYGAEINPLACEDEMSGFWSGQARFNIDD